MTQSSVRKKHSPSELDVHERPESCNGCPLRSLGHSFSRVDGSGRNGVLLLGEALGETEAIKGLPFQGDAGFLLNKALQRGGLRREDFLITNVIRCHPPENYLEGAPYELAATDHCDHHFRGVLASHPEVKAVVAIGNVAMHKMLGQKGVKNWHGTVHWNDRYKVWVIPTLHPSFILRSGHKELPTLVYDIGVALRVARLGFQRSAVDYILYPTPRVLEQWADTYEQELSRDADLLLASDIETAYSRDHDEEDVLEKDGSWTITTISFSYAVNRAITVPWRQDYIEAIMRLLGTNGTKCWWNGNKFDLPRLRHAGASIQGINIDAMDAWHVLRPDLPKGLGYVSPFYTDIAPWKHLNHEQPEYYSCVDADSLLRIMLKIRTHMRAEGTWNTFIKYWTQVEPVFSAMSEVGIGINEEKRLSLKSRFEEVRDNTALLIQGHIPAELKPLLKKGGYRGKPKDVRAYIKEHQLDGHTDDEGWRACGYSQFHYIIGTQDRATQQEVQAEDAASRVELRWNKCNDFNHNSPDQIINYITAAYGREAVPRNKKTGQPTTGAQELEQLARKKDDAVLNLILDAANADGKITSFITPWSPGPDGRVHGVFTNQPATPRIASQSPNLQNFPIRSEEAALMRQMIVPGDGWEYLWECVAPETKILKADLSWCRADEIKLGEELLSFEDHQCVGRKDSIFKGGVVTNNAIINKNRLRITTTEGVIVVAEDHPFLARKRSCARKWVKAKDLKPNHQLTFLTKPWEYDNSRTGGYLAGFLDGEGWVHRHTTGWAQNPGPTHDYAKSLFEERGFEFAETPCNSTASCYTTNLVNSLRVLGSIRPARLLRKARQVWDGRRTWGKRTPIVKIVSVESIGPGPVIALETTTGTYIANGFFSHNCDYKGIEAIIVGILAKDPDYVRLAYRSVHAFVASAACGRVINLNCSDADLDLALKEAKTISQAQIMPGSHTTMYDAAKRTVHGSNYLEGALLLTKTFPDVFPTAKDAQRLQDLYFDLFPKISVWQNDTIDFCEEHNYVMNPWGIKRWLWNVKRWAYSVRTKKWEQKLAEDAKKAIATSPQGSAGMIMRGALVSDPASELIAEQSLMITIHDSLVGRARDKRHLEWCLETCKRAMEYAIKELGNIVVPVEAKVGYNWGQMKEIKI